MTMRSSRRPPFTATLMLMGLAAFACASPQVDDVASGALAEVLVTGERPGPSLWHASKNGHDLWILGTLQPLPKGMVWRSDSVESRIAASQSVLAPPGVNPHIGFFRSLGLLPAALRARHRPDGATLEQTLPHEVYMRWLALRVRYLNGSADDEPLRPLLAAFDLYQHALAAAGLSDDDGVWQSVEKTAHRYRVPVTRVTVDIPVEDPKGLIRDLEHIPLDQEVACLTAAIAHIESDMGLMRQRANLWALGDVEALLRTRYADDGMSCLNAVTAVPALDQQLKSAERQARDVWIAKVEEAVGRNDSSFAVLPLRHLHDAENWLPLLEARGYRVSLPQ